MIITLCYNEPLPDGFEEVNVTSRGDYKSLSPFNKTDIYCYDNLFSKNVENAWQFSKVYKKYDNLGEPSEEWFKWRDKGFLDSWAHRYPMGKGAIPEYSWWDGEKLGYIEARKNIYFPLYIKSIENNKDLEVLKEKVNKGKRLAIRDFDCYNFKKIKLTLKDVINNPSLKAGHGFCVYHLLTGEKYV